MNRKIASRENQTDKKRYKGVLSFVGNELQLKIDSLDIVERDVLTLSMHAINNEENYTADIKCNWNEKEGGFYFSNLGEIKRNLYSDYVNPFALKVTQLIQSDTECKIEALWIQDQQEFVVNATLS